MHIRAQLITHVLKPKLHSFVHKNGSFFSQKKYPKDKLKMKMPEHTNRKKS